MTPSKSPDAVLKAIADLVTGGQMREARETIRRLTPRRFTRAQRYQLALSSYRCGWPSQSLLILRSLVYPGPRSALKATLEERVLYARALALIGDSNEAIRLLADVDIRSVASAMNDWAYVHFRAWDWDGPRPVLEKLAVSDQVTPRDRRRASHLLAIALMHGSKPDLSRAEKLHLQSMEMVASTREVHHHRDSLQLLAQIRYFQGRYKDALEFITQGEALVRDADDSTMTLMYEQWRALAEFGLGDRTALKRLHATQERADRAGLIAIARACSFYEAIATRDHELMLRLWFSSSNPVFRRKLLEAFGVSESDLPESYAMEIGPGPARARIVVDALNGTGGPSRSKLKPGHSMQRMFAALALDPSHPPNLAELHEKMSPDEQFNPVVIPVRVRQIMKRLRQWLKSARLGLRIEETDGRYRLVADRPVSVLLRRELVGGSITPRLRELQERWARKFGKEEIRGKDVEALLGVSDTTAREVLRDALDAGLVIRSGQARATRYRIA